MTASEIEAQISALETRIASFAGIRQTTFSDQSTSFSLQDAHAELSRLRGLLATVQTGSRTRFAATSKGC